MRTYEGFLYRFNKVVNICLIYSSMRDREKLKKELEELEK